MGTSSSVLGFSPCKWGVMVFFLPSSHVWNNLLCIVRNSWFLLHIPTAGRCVLGLEQHQSLCLVPAILQLPAWVSGFLPLVASWKEVPQFIPVPALPGCSRSRDRRTARAWLSLPLPRAPSPVLQNIPHSTPACNFSVSEDVLRETENSSRF